jgi:ferric-chelate reductase
MSELEFISSDIIRLTISRPGHFHWSPGQSAYLTIPEVAKFPPEAHPFTIATVDYEDESESNTTENENSEDKGPSKSELVFFINVRSGFTKRLAGLTSLNAKKMNMIVLVDGPYGSPPDLRVYDTCVLIAGECPCSFVDWK